MPTATQKAFQARVWFQAQIIIHGDDWFPEFYMTHSIDLRNKGRYTSLGDDVVAKNLRKTYDQCPKGLSATNVRAERVNHKMVNAGGPGTAIRRAAEELAHTSPSSMANTPISLLSATDQAVFSTLSAKVEELNESVLLLADVIAPPHKESPSHVSD